MMFRDFGHSKAPTGRSIQCCWGEIQEEVYVQGFQGLEGLVRQLSFLLFGRVFLRVH
jgi:hypothetical protein